MDDVPVLGARRAAGEERRGTDHVDGFSVPAGSLPFWKTRLRQRGLDVQDAAPRFGEESVAVADSSGLGFELVASDRDDRTPWTGGGVGAEAAVRGLHSVTMTVRSPAKTLALMTGLLGYDVVNEAEGRTRVAVNGDAPGKTIEIMHAPDADAAINGLGTVHHVAMAIANGDEQLRMRAELVRYGLHVTEVRDRCYFTSIYFREPGGVLFEIATVPPGFLIDESVDRLGQALQLPPWEEPFRAEIERGLARVKHP